MNATESAQCISLEDLAEMTNEELERVKKAAADPSDGTGFYIAVRTLQSLVTTCYQCAARMARRTTDLRKLCEIWKGVSEVCDTVLRDMKSLKHTRPDCGTGQMYDLVLDYKKAAFDRYQSNLEALQWEKTEIPAWLFPKSN